MLEISAQNINRLISVLSEKLTLFTTYQLMLFLTSSLGTFNQIPPFTNFTFEDTEFINLILEHYLQFPRRQIDHNVEIR
jgi:hypothetical protein